MSLILFVFFFLISFHVIINVFLRKEYICIVIAITAGLFFLASLLTTSVLYSLLKVVAGRPAYLCLVFLSVLAQTFFRFAFLQTYDTVVRKVSQVVFGRDSSTMQTVPSTRFPARVSNCNVGRDSSTNDPQSSSVNRQDHDQHVGAASFSFNAGDASLSAGFGWGWMHFSCVFGNIWVNAIGGGEGDDFLERCPSIPSLLLSSMNAFLFLLLDLCLMILCMYTLNYGGGGGIHSSFWFYISFAFHCSSALFSLINLFDNGCFLSLPLLGAIVVIVCVICGNKWQFLRKVTVVISHLQAD